MKKILLLGNPNVGKSVVFSRLTGANVIASNYPGTTIDLKKGYIRINGEKYEVIDIPGIYSLEPTSKAEEVAAQILEEGDIVINVLDSTNLERNLYLTSQLLERDIPVVIALNMWDEAKHIGVNIDLDKLKNHLEVPITPTIALTGEGIKELVSSIKRAEIGRFEKKEEDKRWAEIGKIIKDVQDITRKHHTLKDKLSELTIRPATGLPIAFFVIFLAFWLVRFIGEGIITYITDPIFSNLYTPIILRLSELIGEGYLHDILIGEIVEGKVAYMESMGILTTGVYVPFGAVMPYIIAFYFGLSILEDTGYLPRLATLVDNVFHRLGMHGYGIVPLFLGLGCNVPGVLSTRVFDTKRERFISATLLSISVPCMAQIAMIFGILGVFGLRYIYMVFGTLILIYIVFGLLLNYLVKGESPEIFMEIPPYRRPSLRTILKKTFTRVRGFLKEAVPWLFFGILLINVMYFAGILDILGNLFAPIIVNLFGLPKGAISALIIGFLRKDLAVGMLLGLGMGPYQLVIAVTVLTMYFPCAATFAVLFKELGLKDLLKAIGFMFIAVLTVGTIMRLILFGI